MYKISNGEKIQITKKSKSIEGYKDKEDSPASIFFGTFFADMGIGIVSIFLLLAIVLYFALKK